MQELAVLNPATEDLAVEEGGGVRRDARLLGDRLRAHLHARLLLLRPRA